VLLKWLDERTTVQKKERLVRMKTEVLEKSDQLLAIVSQKLKETNKYFGTETLAENMCLLCKKHKVSIIFMNCGHAIVCQFCVKHIKQICILCKNRIQYSIFATPQEISEVVDRKTLALSADKTISVEDTDVSEQEVQEFVTKLDLFADNDHLARPQESGLNSPAFNVSNRDMHLTDDFNLLRHDNNYNTRADSPFSDNHNQAIPDFKPPQKLPISKTPQ
jgi:ribosomal protein L7Ae-like RNA K-turn-binding protein